MTDRVDTTMKPVQMSFGNEARNGIAVVPETHQLPERHDAMLSRRKLSETWCI